MGLEDDAVTQLIGGADVRRRRRGLAQHRGAGSDKVDRSGEVLFDDPVTGIEEESLRVLVSEGCIDEAFVLAEIRQIVIVGHPDAFGLDRPVSPQPGEIGAQPTAGDLLVDQWLSNDQISGDQTVGVITGGREADLQCVGS